MEKHNNLHTIKQIRNFRYFSCIMRAKIILLLLINTSVAFSQDINILEKFNGDFEVGMAFWRFFEVPNNIGSYYEVTDDAISGNQAMKLVWVATDGTVNDRGFDNWSASVPVFALTEYSVKAFMKSENPSGLHITFTVGFFNSAGSVISQVNNNYDLTDTYSENGFLVTTPEKAVFCWIAFRMFDTDNERVAGTMYIDNVQMLGDSIASTDLSPRVMATSLPSSDVPIASIDVTEEPYNAKNDGSVDATTAFQDAINRARIAGGAVVYVPAGTYRFDGSINIPERVVLRGEWENPDSVGNVSGTILMPYAGQGSEDGNPFIIMQTGSGIKNLSIWYPEQSVSSVSPYPWTISCTSVSTSVINVTLVNSYNGIKILPDHNALHYIRNVYGTPLNQGIWLSQTTDIGRIMNVHFEPKYWNKSGLVDSPSENDILSWLQNNNTIGLVMGRSDWEYIYDVSFIGYQTGIQIIKYSDFGPNGVIYGLRIEKSRIGIDLVDLNPIGWAITNAIIKVEGTNSSCVRTGDAFNSVVQFNTCTFGGDPDNAIKFSDNSTGRLSFQNCSFENWGQSGDGAAIDCEQGSLSLMGNTFNQDKLHLRLGTDVTNSHILDNTFPTELKIDNKSTGEVLISHESLSLTRQDVPVHPYAVVPRPANNNLYNVTDFGAVADGSTDNTIAFQTALDTARQNGGGTVYIPSGMYRLNGHITIPNGVELRGIWDVPHHSSVKGSILLAYEGKGSADGTPFISMETGSGVRGFTVWYPEQSSVSFFAYPWSIQTLGENCWIKDVTLGNTYQGVDMASYPSAGHVISYLGAAPLKTGISVDKSTGDGWIENVQLNPHYWAHTSGYPQVETPDINRIISYQQDNLDAFKIASATKEHILGNFVFAAKRGMYLAPDNGNSNINIFLHGTDAGNNSVFLESKEGSKINFVNTQLVLLGTEQNGIITSVPGFGADVSFFNSISWGGNGSTTNLTGNGNIIIQQIHTHNGKFYLNGGDVRLENIAISSTLNPQYNIGSDISELKLFGSYAKNGFVIYNYAEDRNIVEIDYYYNKNIKETTLITGWEVGDTQNSWNNTFYGNKDFIIDDDNTFYCGRVETDDAHSGSKVLKILGNKIEEDVPFYKVFEHNIFVYQNSTLSYWLNPQNESGRSGHVDLLFTDGTFLSDLLPKANDGLLLNANRGVNGEWIDVKCAVGDYANGKVIQTILVGAELGTNEEYSFLIDDFKIDGITSVKSILSDNTELLLQNYPNPFINSTTITYNIQKSGFVTLIIYDMLGKKIECIENNQFKIEGSYNLNWTPDNIDEGIYFYKLDFLSETGNESVVSNKMILLKQ